MFSENDSPADAGSPASNVQGHDEQVPSADAAGAPSTTGRLPGSRRRSTQTFLLSNINRLISPSGRTKSGFLSDLASDNQSLFLGITETWCHTGVLDSELLHNFPGYCVYRQDRDIREGGGVCLFLRDDLTGEVIGTFDNGVCCMLVCRIHQLNTLVCVAYRPPNSMFSDFTDMTAHIDDVLRESQKPGETVILMGDFNFPRDVIKWKRDEDEGFLYPVVADHRDGEDGGRVRAQAQRLVNLALKYHLIQEVEQPTHCASTLDLIWTNDAHLVSTVIVEDWQSFTDHKVVIAHSTFQLGRDDQVREEMHLLESGRRLKKLDFNKADWPQIKTELAVIDWSHMEGLEPTSSLSWFFAQVLPVLERHVPERKVRSKRRKPMMDRRRRLLWNRLRKCKAKLKSANSLNHLTKLLQNKAGLELELSQDYDAINKMEEDQAVLRIKENPKAFFSFAKRRQTTRARIGPFLDPSTGQPNPSPDFAASELSNQYKSVFVQPREAWIIDYVKDFFTGAATPEPSLSELVFSEDDIVKACKELKASSAAGADGVPAALLKNCCNELKHPLFLFWRSSMDTGCIPPDLLLVLVSPVHKGGSRGIAKKLQTSSTDQSYCQSI